MLNPILIIACLVGIIYAIWVGVQFAKADSADQRKESKNKLIMVIVGVVAAGAIIGGFFWLKNLIITDNVKLDTSCCTGEYAQWNETKTEVVPCQTCKDKGSQCKNLCHCGSCCKTETVNGKLYIHGITDPNYWKDQDGNVVSDPNKKTTNPNIDSGEDDGDKSESPNNLSISSVALTNNCACDDKHTAVLPKQEYTLFYNFLYKDKKWALYI